MTFAEQVRNRGAEATRLQVCASMKAAPAMAAFCIFLALSISHCSALVHTAELLPVGQLLKIDRASSGRHLLKASSRLVKDLEGVNLTAGTCMTGYSPASLGKISRAIVTSHA